MAGESELRIPSGPAISWPSVLVVFLLLAAASYGALIKELHLLARAVFVVGPDDKLKYVEYVSEIANHPNYDAVLAAAK